MAGNALGTAGFSDGVALAARLSAVQLGFLARKGMARLIPLCKIPGNFDLRSELNHA